MAIDGTYFTKFSSCLIIPPSKEVDGHDQSNTPPSLNLYEIMKDLDRINYYGPNMKTLTMSQELKESCCIGSSHGWLIFLTSISTQARIILLNPFTHAKIQLPTLESFQGIRSIETIPDQDGKFRVEYEVTNSRLTSFYDQIQQFLPKIVLSANPFVDDSFMAVCMYKTTSKYSLMFYHHGEKDNGWICLEKECCYYDIICSGHILYGLSSGPSIDMCDLRNGNKVRFQFPGLPSLLGYNGKIVPRSLYFSQWYLASSSVKEDDIFLVVRYIGEFVRYDGELVTEADTLREDDTHPLVCPYRTICFHVYKLDFVSKRWKKEKILKDYALFVGGNQSVALSVKENPECRGNVIYFTDDCWDRMHEDYLYGGHDMGIFNMEDGSIEPIFDCEIEGSVPPPVWVLPH